MPSPELLNVQGLLGAQPDKLGLSEGLYSTIRYEVLRHTPDEDPEVRTQAAIRLITGETEIW